MYFSGMRKILRIISLLVLVTFTFQQTSFAIPSYKNLAPSPELHGPTQDEVERAAGELTHQPEEGRESLGDASGIELQDAVEDTRRIQPIIFSFDRGSEPWIDWDTIELVRNERPEDYKAMVGQMKAVMMSARYSDESIRTMDDSSLIREFTAFASSVIRKRLNYLPLAHDIDPHTSVAIEWGSKKLAYFHRRAHNPDFATAYCRKSHKRY